MRQLRGPLRQDAHDLLLGATHSVRGRKIGEKSMEVIHKAVCAYLSKCWRERAAWFGGVPRRGTEILNKLVIVANVWAALRGRQQ
jgi:hypothetical protein